MTDRASVDTVRYAHATRNMAARYGRAITALYAATLRASAHTGAPYRSTELTTVVSSALTLCRGAPTFGISLEMSRWTLEAFSAA